MLWAFEVLSSIYFGYSFVTYLIGNGLDPIQRIFAGSPIGFYFFAWLCFIFSYKRKLDFYVAIPSLLIQTILTIYFQIKIKNSEIKLKTKIKFKKTQIFTLLLFSAFFTYLMYVSMLYQGRRSKAAGYGDIPFHMNIISSFVTGCNHKRQSFLEIETVFYAGEKLAYPFMTNFYTATLMATGRATMRAALLFPSIIISISLVFGIYYLGIFFHQSHLCSLIALIMFCNLGGLGFTRLFDKKLYKNFNYDLIHNWGDKIIAYWFHPLMHVLIPQRASLWSMPLCYWCILCLLKGMEEKNIDFFILAAIYVGITPLVQMHSYVALAQWAIVYAILNFPWKQPKCWLEHIKLWLTFALIANILAVPQFTPYLNRLSSKINGKRSFVNLNPIWNSNEWPKKWYTPIILWWKSLGVFAFVSLISGLFVLSKKQLTIYLPSLVVFIITNFIRYQPWNLDNTKVFYASWIPIAIHVYALFMYRVFDHPKLIPIGFCLICTSTISAAFYTLKTLLTKSNMFEDDAIYFGNWLNENVPINTIFYTSQWHANPSLIFGGRKAYMGYGGWVTSHGLEFFQRNRIANVMKDNPKDISIFDKNNISYSCSHKNNFRNWKNITRDDNWVKIYDYFNFELWKRIK